MQVASGINATMMGGHSPARRTALENRIASTAGTQRQHTIATYFSPTGFRSLAARLAMNCQQFYSAEQVIRRAGALPDEDGVEISSDTIQGGFNFIPFDGSLPLDRQAMAVVWREYLETLMQLPEFIQKYDINEIIGYVMSLMGVKDLEQFRRKEPLANPETISANGQNPPTPSLPGATTGAQLSGLPEAKRVAAGTGNQYT